MAVQVTAIYCRHAEQHDGVLRFVVERSRCPFCSGRYTLVRSVAESKGLNARTGRMIIVSASGMATGGRILHHLKARLPDERTTVLLPGFQAAGTRGRKLLDGARVVRMLGEDVPVRARVVTLGGLSAHADRDDLVRWLRGFVRPPRVAYVVHGESEPAQALAATIRRELGWNAAVARDGESVDLHG